MNNQENNARLDGISKRVESEIKVGDVIDTLGGPYTLEEIDEYKGKKVGFSYMNGKRYLFFLQGLLPKVKP